MIGQRLKYRHSCYVRIISVDFGKFDWSRSRCIMEVIVNTERGNSMRVEVLPAQEGDYQLNDYDALKRSFTWDALKDAFAFKQTGKVNIAYEAIDRHAESDKKNKTALLFS